MRPDVPVVVDRELPEPNDLRVRACHEERIAADVLGAVAVAKDDQGARPRPPRLDVVDLGETGRTADHHAPQLGKDEELIFA